MYALEGAWNTGSVDGCQVLGIAEDKEVLQDILGLIAESQAGEYVMGHVWDGISDDVLFSPRKCGIVAIMSPDTYQIYKEWKEPKISHCKEHQEK